MKKRRRNGTLARQRSNHLRAADEDSKRQWRAAQDLRDLAISAQEHGSARLLAGHSYPVLLSAYKTHIFCRRLRRNRMTEGTLSRKLRSSACVIGCWLGLAVTVSAGGNQLQGPAW